MVKQVARGIAHEHRSDFRHSFINLKQFAPQKNNSNNCVRKEEYRAIEQLSCLWSVGGACGEG